MRRSLVGLATLMVVGAASAQSSVTLFGVIDMAVSGYKNQSVTPSGLAVDVSKTALSSSGYTTSRLGFRGTEDLGGGFAASFWLEAGMSPDTGSGAATGGGIAFNRRSTVSLSSGLGEIRLGRDYTPTYWNDAVFDPFGNLGVGGSLIYTASGGAALGVPGSGFQSNPNYIRASNSIGYLLPPNLGGIYGQFLYALNEKTNYDPGGLTPPGVAAVVANPALATADNARAGRYIGGRLGYMSGPLDTAVAFARSTIASNFFVGTTTNLDIWSIGASYDFGMVKLFGEYSNNKQDVNFATNTFNPVGTTKPGANGALLGFSIPVGASLIRASWSEVRYNNLPVGVFASQPEADQFAIGYVYNLSKRSALYASASYLDNKNGAALAVGGAPGFYTATAPGGVGNAVPNKSMGYDLGFRHIF
ncbi:porin [Variovorax ginsengisoli]|uniref:Porin n=1 Tax=Variovorax ginsengisoli TaxID=363844 RepID=A0ABT8S9L9_9BURK|nr:porin [Variovorax ginsengisoli]MDN8616445.1 porin [Variovorax ginsengisoli]MDO1535615.1 porin [Variovorax ginsengisoli]